MNELDSEYGNLLLKDDVVHLTYKNGAQISLEMAHKIVVDRSRLTDNKLHLVLIKDNGVKGINKDARDYLSSDAGVKGLKAAGLVVKSEFSKFLANFFIKVNVISPKIPAKVFTSEADALRWLEQFK